MKTDEERAYDLMGEDVQECLRVLGEYDDPQNRNEYPGRTWHWLMRNIVIPKLTVLVEANRCGVKLVRQQKG